jgi:hypothetical protein
LGRLALSAAAEETAMVAMAAWVNAVEAVSATVTATKMTNSVPLRRE